MLRIRVVILIYNLLPVQNDNALKCLYSFYTISRLSDYNVQYNIMKL